MNRASFQATADPGFFIKVSGALNDPQTFIGRIPSLFPQEECEDRQAAQPGDFQNAQSGRGARAGSAVLQVARLMSQKQRPFCECNHKLRLAG